MEHQHLRRRRRCCLLLLLAVCWPAAAAATAAAEACHDGDDQSTHAGCEDASGLARRHGDVWRERAGGGRAGSGCVRRVSACVDGQLLRPVPDRVERCPRARANHACLMESFFTCCPIYDCPSKLASLIAPLSPGQHTRSVAVDMFLSRVEGPDLLNADALPLPVARPQLNATAIRQLLGWLAGRPEPTSAAERAVQTELRHILTVLEPAGAAPTEPAGAAPTEPAEVRGALRLLRRLSAPRRRAAALLLRRLLERLDGGQLQPPLTAAMLLTTMMSLVETRQLGPAVTAADVTSVATALFQLQLDSGNTPLGQSLRYIVMYGRLDADDGGTQPDGRTATGEACSGAQEGLVWAEMEAPVDGQCTRHVRGCRAGLVVSTPELQDRRHTCDVTGPELCRLDSFFTCCPVFDCGETLRTLETQDSRPGSLTADQFRRLVSPADLASVTSPVPIVGRSLHRQTVEDMRSLLGNSTPQERLVRRELDLISELLRPVGPPAPPGAVAILLGLLPTLDAIGSSVSVRGTAVSSDTLLDVMVSALRMHELHDALVSGALPESAVPAELPAAAARLLLLLTSAGRGIPLQRDLIQLVQAAAGGQPTAGPQLAALFAELGRVLDAWQAFVPASAFAQLPSLRPLGPGAAPLSLWTLLSWLLTARDGLQPTPLVRPTDPANSDDELRLAAVLQLLERLQQGGQPTGPLRPALVQLVRQLTRPDGADSPDTVHLLLTLGRRLARGPTGLQPDVLRAVVDLLGSLGSHRQPAAASPVLQLLLQLVDGLTPQHSVVSAETRALIVELLQRLDSRPDSVEPDALQLVITVVRQLAEVTRRDVRPAMLGHLLTLLGRMSAAPAAADPAAFQVLVRLVGQLGETHTGSAENASVLRLLLQMLQTLTDEPAAAAPESIQLLIRLVEQFGRPHSDAGSMEATQLILQLIEGLRRSQRPPPPQLGRQLVQLVVQLGRRHGPAAPPLRQLMLALLPLLSRQAPRSAAMPDGMLQVLLSMVQGVTQGRAAPGRPGWEQLLVQLTEQLASQRRPLPAPVRKLLLELFIGTQQPGGVSESEVMTLVLTMLELLSQAPDVPSAGFNITVVSDSEPDPDLLDLQRLIELLFRQGRLGGRTATDITVLLQGDDSDSRDTDELLRLLLTMMQTEANTPSDPGFNITAVITNDEQRDFTGILQLFEAMIARMNTSRPQTSGFVNITGILVGEERNDGFQDMQAVIEMLLARMSTMAGRPREQGFVNITLVNEQSNQFDEFRSILEMIMLEIETMKSNPHPTGFVNISTVLVDDSPRDYTQMQELLALLMAQLTADTEPRPPGFINISLVQNDQDEFRNMGYLLELLMTQLRRDSAAQPGFNISGVLVSPGRDGSTDIQTMLRLLLEQLSASQTADFPGFLNISGIMVNGEQTDMKNLRLLLESVMTRMSAGHDLPAGELSTYWELIQGFFTRPSSSQDIDVQGIINMLIELGDRDTEPTFSIGDFIALIQSLDVPADHPTFTDDIRRLIILLQQGSQAPSFLSDLTEVVVRLLRLLQTSGRATHVSPEMLIRFIVRQTTRPAAAGPDGADALLTALLGILEGSGGTHRTSFTFDVVMTPPDSLPASLRGLVMQLQRAARQPQPLLQSLPRLLRLLTALAGPAGRGAPPDLLQFAAQLATAVLRRATDAADRVLVPQILQQLGLLARQPRPHQLTAATVLLRRLLRLEQQRRPIGGGVSGRDTSASLMTLLQGLLRGRASVGGASPLPELTQSLLDVLLRLERDGGEARPLDLLPKLVAVLQLAVSPPADAGRLPDDSLRYVTELTRAVLERLAPHADPLLPRVLVLLRRLGPRPQAAGLRDVLAVLEQLLERHQIGAPGVGVPSGLLTVLLQLEKVSERGRPADYLPLVVTLLRQAGQQPDQTDPALRTYFTRLVHILLRRDADHLHPLLRPRVRALISGGGAGIAELLPLLELLVNLQTGNDAGFGGFGDLFGFPTPGGRTASGGVDAQFDFASWLMDLMGNGADEEAPELRQTLSHLIHLLRQRGSRPDHNVDFVAPEDAVNLVLLLSGQAYDPTVVPVSAFDSVLSLLDPEHEPEPSHTALGLFRELMERVWGAAGPDLNADLATMYRRLLAVLTDSPVGVPASEAALRHALLLLLSGPAAAQPTADSTEATRVLLSLVTWSAGGGAPQLVPAAVLRVLASLLDAAAAGGQTAAVPESALRFLVQLLSEPEWRGSQPAPEQLVRLLVSVVSTGTADSGRHGPQEVALRLLLRLLDGRDGHRTIPIRQDWLRDLLTLPDSRSGASDGDGDALMVLMGLLSDPNSGVSGLPDDFMTAVLSGMGGSGGFDPDQVPDSDYTELTKLLFADEFDPSSGAAQRVLLTLGGGRLRPEQLFERVLLLLARRGGLPGAAVSPPGRLLRRCRLLCDAAGGQRQSGVQVLSGRTPITFVGENHVIVLNG